MAITTSNTPSSLEAEASYFWHMARGLHNAQRRGNDKRADEYAEALELLADMDDHAAVRTAAHRSLAPLPAWVPSVVLKFPVSSASRIDRQHAPQPKRKTRRRA